jgi:hypothetical protein
LVVVAAAAVMASEDVGKRQSEQITLKKVDVFE